MHARAQPRLPAQRYDGTTIALHWLTAALVAGQWIGGHTIDWFPRGPLRIDARSVHITAGALLVLVTGFRLYWRASSGRRLPPAAAGLLGVAARAMRWGLWIDLAALLGLGLTLAWLRGDSLYNIAHIPAFGDFQPKARHLLAERITDLHSLAANLLLALAALHAAAALLHHFAWRDGVLRRML